MSEDSPARKRPSGLGRGLSSLLGEVAQEAPVTGAATRGNIQLMPVSSIEPRSEPSSGGRNQARTARRREKTLMSSSWPTTKAQAEARAMRWVVAGVPPAFQGRGLKLR